MPWVWARSANWARAWGEVLRGEGVWRVGVRVGGVADVIDAFKQDEEADAGAGEDVLVKAGEGAGAGIVMQEAIAADAFIQDGEGAKFLVVGEAVG